MLPENPLQVQGRTSASQAPSGWCQQLLALMKSYMTMSLAGGRSRGGSLNFGRKEKHAGQEHSYIVRVIIWLLANSWSPERQRGEGLVKISSVFFSANTTRKNGNQLSWQSFCLPVIEAFMILKNVYKDTSTWVSCE